LAVGLRRLSHEKIPETAILSAAFFVVGAIHVPLGPVAVHLVLNGLIGLLLGWAAFPAIFVGLSLQMLLLQEGGLTTLGLNTFNMAAPAVLVYCAFASLARSENKTVAYSAGAAAGASALLLSAALNAASLYLGGRNGAFEELAAGFFVAHLPLILVEACVTAFAVGFVRVVSPDLLSRAKIDLAA
jgi:cobalt/nickel transport system permease protein